MGSVWGGGVAVVMGRAGGGGGGPGVVRGDAVLKGAGQAEVDRLGRRGEVHRLRLLVDVWRLLVGRAAARVAGPQAGGRAVLRAGRPTVDIDTLLLLNQYTDKHVFFPLSNLQ